MVPYKTCPVCGTPEGLAAPDCLACGHVYQTVFIRPQKPRTSFWPAVLVLGCAAPCILGLLLFVLGLGRAMTEADPPPPVAAPAEIAATRIHQGDVRGRATDGTLILRCTLCRGTGQVPHFSHTGDGRVPWDYQADGGMPCPVCLGSGSMRASSLAKPVAVVPDSEPADY